MHHFRPHRFCLIGEKVFFVVLFFSVLHADTSFAQDTPTRNGTSQEAASPGTLVLQRLSGPIVLDGRVDDIAWSKIDPVPLIQYQPVYLGEMSERTEIRVAYDDKYIWVSAKMYESDPANIRANTLTRDGSSSDDIFAIVLDTFKDNENALWFSTTPLGARIDRAVSSDAEFTGGGFESVMNVSWNTYWDAVSTTTQEGWFSEMRIPYSSLGFQDVNGRVEMGMILYRYMARSSERHIYPPIQPVFDLGFVKPSQAQTIILENVSSGKPVYITPYISGGIIQESELNSDGSGFELGNDVSRDIGGDLKYSVNDNLTLDLTINTDFAQVEADEQQVNLTRFSLFFPEKRQFFQERAGIYNFSTGTVDRVFHSRQIGISDSGLVSIAAGGRLVGRIGSWDVGAINMQTLKSDALPAENFGILRLRRRVFNPRSTVGTLLTSRLGNDGTYNLVYALDAVLNVRKTDYMTAKWVQTFADTPYRQNDSSESEKFDFAESIFATAHYERRGRVGLAFKGLLSYAGTDHNPGIGFVLRRNFWSYLGDVKYGWLYDGTSIIRTLQMSTSIQSYMRNGDGSLESLIAKHEWNSDLTTGARTSASAQFEIEDLDSELELPGESTVPAGRYEFASVGASYDFPFGTLFRGDYSVLGGQFYDGWRAQINLGPTWTVSKHLEFDGRYQYSYLRFSVRDQTTHVHLIGLTTKIGFNTKFSLSALGQYNTADDLFSSNVRLRYNFAENNDLWIVFNQNMNSDRTRQHPELAVIENRSILLKYTYTFYR